MRNCCVLLISRAVPAARSRRKRTFVFPECFVAETGRRRPAHNSTFLETQMSVFEVLNVPGAYASSFIPGVSRPTKRGTDALRHPRLSRRSRSHVVDAGGGRRADDRPASGPSTASSRRACSVRRRGWARRKRPAPCAVPAPALSSTARLPRPRSSCWASTSWTARPKRPPSRLRATCAAPIRLRSTKSARCPFICREWPSRSPRPKRTAISGDTGAVVEAS